MANTSIKSKVTLDFKLNLELDMDEAMALEKIVLYGDKAFLEMFYSNLGRAYLEPHEKGLKSLFNTIKNDLTASINEAAEISKKAKELQRGK